jgi:putative redox protein
MAEAEGVVVVRGGAQGFVQEITAGRHHLVTDEPTGAGGTDRGPGPYDLLMAALGSCMSMTIALYARTKKWPLETVVIRLTHSRVYAKDCLDCVVRDDTMLDRINTQVQLSGALTGEQERKLMEVAHKCPVHRTLKSEIDIREVTSTGGPA